MEVAPASGSPAQPNTDAPANTRNHKLKDGSVKVWCLGDSHLRDNHHFPAAYEKAKADGITDPRFGPLSRKTEWEQVEDPKTHPFAEGFYLDEPYKQQVLGLVEQSRGKATAILLSIGSNDLRKARGTATINVLLGRLRAIMDKVQETPGVILHLLEPIPCSKGIDQARALLSRKLLAECKQHSKVRYVPITKGTRPLLPEKHSWELWEDELHLNEEGAAKLVEAWLRVQRVTKTEFFLEDSAAVQQRQRVAEKKVTKPDGRAKKRGAKTPGKTTKQGDAPPAQSIFTSGRIGKRTIPQKGGVFSRLGYKTGGMGGMSTLSSQPRKPDLEHYRQGRDKAYKALQAELARIDRCEKEGIPIDDNWERDQPTATITRPATQQAATETAPTPTPPAPSNTLSQGAPGQPPAQQGGGGPTKPAVLPGGYPYQYGYYPPPFWSFPPPRS